MSADLYSNSEVQRNLEGLCSSKVKVNFSATGRGLQLAEKAAKYEKTGASLVNFSDNNDLLAEKGVFEQLI